MNFCGNEGGGKRIEKEENSVKAKGGGWGRKRSEKEGFPKSRQLSTFRELEEKWGSVGAGKLKGIGARNKRNAKQDVKPDAKQGGP